LAIPHLLKPRTVGLRTLVLLVLAAGCRQAELVREFLRDPTPHQEYLVGLWEAGLASSALGQDWILASGEALANPVAVEAPYQEAGFFPPEEAASRGYRFPLRRGQRLVLTVELESPAPARVFVDLFRAAPDTLRGPVPVLSGEAGVEMVYEPRRSGEYLLRVQPELLRGGRFLVTIENGPALEFPVAGRTSRSIGSLFGDSRDAGRREHHGVDIFAPRGTPVLAAAEAYVTRVDTTRVGGRVIWLRDSIRNASLYYAHLQEPLVRRGARVMPGDTIGLVGNTGNAVTTPPHLHFGLYVRGEGPVDPWDFLYRTSTEMVRVEVELAALGEWVRVARDEIHLREGPSIRSQVLAELPRDAAVRVYGGVGTWYRVRLPDGAAGFVSSRLTERAERPVRLEADR
jgi:peptidoglycan LD-endopeptidase LytH